MRERGAPLAQGDRGGPVSSGPQSQGRGGSGEGSGGRREVGVSIRKEPATVTRRFSESLGFALMPLGFKIQRLLAREWCPHWRRRSDGTFQRPDLNRAQPGRLAGNSDHWEPPCASHFPGRQDFALTRAGGGAHDNDESLTGT